jgi:hypothetical protein
VATRYVASTDTVDDSQTGLMWQRAVSAGTHLWATANTYCDGLTLAGHSDWRLPTRVELRSIVNTTRTMPAITVVPFPNTPSVRFWSATPYAQDSTRVWTVDFAEGLTAVDPLDIGLGPIVFRMRCVRGAPPSASTLPPARYDLTADTVFDTVTGLTWQRVVGPNEVADWPSSSAYCQAKSIGGLATGWRVPTLNELDSLTDLRASNPAMNTAAFGPITGSMAFWSSSKVSSTVVTGWAISFTDGNATPAIGGGSQLRIRCVR